MWIARNNWCAVISRNKEAFLGLPAFVIFGTDGEEDFVWVESGLPWSFDSEDEAKAVASTLRFSTMAVNVKALAAL